MLNGSALPVTLEGIVSGDEPGSPGPRWIALALPFVPNAFPNGVDQLRAFTPQVIAPNERITLYLVGKAGPCSFGPGFSLDNDSAVAGYVSLPREVQLGYSILGLAGTSSFTMPMQVVEPARQSCP